MKALASPLPASPSRAPSASSNPRASAPVAPAPPPLPDPPIASDISADRIRVRAHAIYEARLASGRSGDAASDWIQAEQELLALDSEIQARARARGETLLANPT